METNHSPRKEFSVAPSVRETARQDLARMKEGTEWGNHPKDVDAYQNTNEEKTSIQTLHHQLETQTDTIYEQLQEEIWHIPQNEVLRLSLFTLLKKVTGALSEAEQLTNGADFQKKKIKIFEAQSELKNVTDLMENIQGKDSSLATAA